MLAVPGAAAVDDQAEGRARPRTPRARAAVARPGFDLAHSWQPRAPRRRRLRAAVSPGRRAAQRRPGRGPRARLRPRQGLPRQAPGAATTAGTCTSPSTGSRTAPPVVTSRLRHLPLGAPGAVGVSMWALEWAAHA